MKDLQLKDISHYLTTTQPIRLNYPTGESMIARISDFDS